MKIDIENWVNENLQNVEKCGDSYQATCPLCGRDGHFYIHSEEGYWKCFKAKCDECGNNLIKLIAKINGITVVEARKIAFAKNVKLSKHSFDPIISNERLEALKKHHEKEIIKNNPPPGMIPVWDNEQKMWRMPNYLLERGITRRLARKLNIGICKENLCSVAPKGCIFPKNNPNCVEKKRCRYGNRIVLPFVCPNGYSFTTRTTRDAIPKYLNPPDKRSRLVYGWELAKKGSDILIVEGPFDVIRLASHGMTAFAIFGLQMSEYQCDLLAKIKPSTITIMLDSGFEQYANKIASKILNITDNVFIAKLPGGIDPGESSREIAWKSFRDAEIYNAARIKMASMSLQKQKKEVICFT